MQQDYLTTEEAAAYLRIKERKLYELVSEGAVPCSKVTGKWLFPRAALDRWIEAGLARPEGFLPVVPPPVVGGSHDPLLEWALRRSGAGLAMLPEGSEAGLARLARDEVAVAAIHVHGDGDDETANAEAVSRFASLHDAVVIGFARREQGLMTAPGDPLGLDGLEAAFGKKARFGLRQKGAGAQLLFEALARRAGVDLPHLVAAPLPYPTGQDLALGIRAGEIDCGLATRAVAQAHGLGFRPLVWERFDLAMRRRTFFEPGPQAVLAIMRSPDFVRKAADFGGYDASEAGRVVLNR
jgi:excisionase family DNA binding protein